MTTNARTDLVRDSDVETERSEEVVRPRRDLARALSQLTRRVRGLEHAVFERGLAPARESDR